MPALSLFAAAWLAVFAAELLGDKSLYTLGTLASRYRIAPVAAGALAAFMVKMLAAVLLGRTIGELRPEPLHPGGADLAGRRQSQ